MAFIYIQMHFQSFNYTTSVGTLRTRTNFSIAADKISVYDEYINARDAT